MNDPNVEIIKAFMTFLGGIIITWLTVKYKGGVARKLSNKPKDRMDTIFDGYEKLIKQQQEDIERKQNHIDHLQVLINKQREQLEASQTMIDVLRDDLNESRRKNKTLEVQLKGMKKDYNGGVI